MVQSVKAEPETPGSTLKAALESFKFESPANQSSVRRSGRTRVATKRSQYLDDVLPSLDDVETKAHVKTEPSDSPPDHTPGTSKSSRKRAGVKLEDTPSAKKVKRAFAPPEQYAHLNFLQDYLRDSLDGELIPIVMEKPRSDILLSSHVLWSQVRIYHDQYHLFWNIHQCLSSPGCKSAEVGHHFANPTNHFWKCLHGSRAYTPEF